MDKLQWGNRKRLRCVKVKDKNNSSSSAAATASFNRKSDGTTSAVVKKKITSGFAHNNNNKAAQRQHNASLPPIPSSHRIHRDLGMSRSNAGQNQKSSLALSPEKEDRYCTTRKSVVLDDNGKMFVDAKEDKKKLVWPRLIITLSSKEKEEDFMAMKGCKLPQRPKKRAKLIQKTILLVSPGAWLSDLCQERYEVREKKTSKKKPRGLKAMGSMESDSE